MFYETIIEMLFLFTLMSINFVGMIESLAPTLQRLKLVLYDCWWYGYTLI